MAFHYADIHYFDDPDCDDDEGTWNFPARAIPGPWDFLYYLLRGGHDLPRSATCRC